MLAPKIAIDFVWHTKRFRNIYAAIAAIWVPKIGRFAESYTVKGRAPYSPETFAE